MNPNPSSAEKNIPTFFSERLKKQFPNDSAVILQTFQRRMPFIRVNTLLTRSQDIQTLFAQEAIDIENMKNFPATFRVLSMDRKRITELKAYQEGQIYLQSLASQLVVKVLDPHPGERILDMCAAPGSKTTQIAILMKAQGELVANEPKRERFFRLMSNLRQQKMEHFVVCKSYPGERYGHYYQEYFDKVLVDAPCSSESRFILGEPKTTRYWSRHKIKAFARLQRKLLASAIVALKPGGTIVYSTCTFAPEENELIIDRILRKYPEMSLLEIPFQEKRLPCLLAWNGKTLDQSLCRALRLYPNESQEGFFIALLQKSKSLL